MRRRVGDPTGIARIPPGNLPKTPTAGMREVLLLFRQVSRMRGRACASVLLRSEYRNKVGRLPREFPNSGAEGDSAPHSEKTEGRF